MQCDLKPSQNKNDYIFGRTMGAGTFGVVRQARRISTNENVAVKILLKKALEGNEVQMEMLHGELCILKALDHPNIIKFIDWFETEDKFYIVTQLATGGELFDRIVAKGKFTERDAAIIMTQILGAVEYMHSMDIVHRDLKPENMLYLDKTDDSQLVIADFGIAKKLESGDELIFKAAGSLGYVAPEVLTSDGHGKPCDIWSIGVIAYTLLCGYCPFASESVEGFLDEVTAKDIPVTFDRPYWDDISKEAKGFIVRALTLDPMKRPTATELLADPWLHCPELQTRNLLEKSKKKFDARKKFREAVEIVKLNNRIKKLKEMYYTLDESDTDLEEVSLNDSLESLVRTYRRTSFHKDPGELTPEQQKLKSALSKDAFVQIVRAASRNRQRTTSRKDTSSRTTTEESIISSISSMSISDDEPKTSVSETPKLS